MLLTITSEHGNIITDIGDDRPDKRELSRHVLQEAAQWEALGLELGLKDYDIDIIAKDHPNDSTMCCRVMLQKWLETDPLASWNKLNDAVEHIRSSITGPLSVVSDDTTGIVSHWRPMHIEYFMLHRVSYCAKIK